MFDLVYISAWISSILFFASRVRFSVENRSISKLLDHAGAISIWIHIACAYAFTHAWSHAAAVKHVADRTEDVVGIRNGTGIYLNFLVAVVWTWLAFSQISDTSRLRNFANAFLWAMFLFASIVFANTLTSFFFGSVVLFVAGSHFIGNRSNLPGRSA